MKKVGVCCDHAGYEMKELLVPYLQSKGYEVQDFGSNTPESCDYADFAHPMAKAQEEGAFGYAFSICGSGNGINMTTNKHQGIRAALCWTPEISALAREHNDANVCSLPARFINFDTCKEIVDVFLATEFAGGRHKRRIDKIPLENCK